ncbi:MAG: SdpI family protein [Planctomycetota bacterium]
MLLLSAIIFVVTGLLFAGLAIPLWRRRVAPNAWYGLRVRATFVDEDVWYDANESSGRDLFWLGVVIAGLSLALVPVPVVDGTQHLTTLLAVTLIGSFLLAWIGIARANRLLRERRTASGSEEVA